MAHYRRHLCAVRHLTPTPVSLYAAHPTKHKSVLPVFIFIITHTHSSAQLLCIHKTGYTLAYRPRHIINQWSGRPGLRARFLLCRGAVFPFFCVRVVFWVRFACGVAVVTAAPLRLGRTQNGSRSCVPLRWPELRCGSHHHMGYSISMMGSLYTQSCLPTGTNTAHMRSLDANFVCVCMCARHARRTLFGPADGVHLIQIWITRAPCALKSFARGTQSWRRLSVCVCVRALK